MRLWWKGVVSWVKGRSKSRGRSLFGVGEVWNGPTEGFVAGRARLRDGMVGVGSERWTVDSTRGY